MNVEEYEKRKKLLNSKLSLGIAVSLILAAILYQIFLFVTFVPLREYIDGKWANATRSFSIDTKQQIVSILNVGIAPVKREYTIVKESRWHITLDVMGEIYDMNFDKMQPDRKKMMMSMDDNPAEEYVKVLKGDIDPSIHKPIVDDPDEKLRKINQMRKQGKFNEE